MFMKTSLTNTPARVLLVDAVHNHIPESLLDRIVADLEVRANEHLTIDVPAFTEDDFDILNRAWTGIVETIDMDGRDLPKPYLCWALTPDTFRVRHSPNMDWSNEDGRDVATKIGTSFGDRSHCGLDIFFEPQGPGLVSQDTLDATKELWYFKDMGSDELGMFMWELANLFIRARWLDWVRARRDQATADAKFQILVTALKNQGFYTVAPASRGSFFMCNAIDRADPTTYAHDHELNTPFSSPDGCATSREGREAIAAYLAVLGGHTTNKHSCLIDALIECSKMNYRKIYEAMVDANVPMMAIAGAVYADWTNRPMNPEQCVEHIEKFLKAM